MAKAEADAAMAEKGGKEARLQLEEPAYTFADMNLRQKCKHIVANITVEPITLLYIVPALLSSLTTQNLNLEKACRVSLNYTDEVCDALAARNFTGEYGTLFSNVAQVVAEMQIWQTPLQSVVPIILVMFVGSWADRRRRRRPFILSPLLGDLISSVGLLLCSIFFSWSLEVAGIIESLVPALFGGMPILFLSVFSYVADVTTPENRTFRIGMVATAVSWGFPIASALSGVAFTTLGFTGVYIVSIALYGLGLAYGYRYIREPHPPVPRPPGVSFLADFCNWRHVWDTVKVALKKRRGSRRLQFYILVLLYFTIQGPIQGEGIVSFLYLTQQFQWEAIAFSAYSTYFIILSAVGNFVATTVFAKWLNMSDCLIGVIAMSSKTVVAPLFALANKSWHVYALTAENILGAGAIITMRGIATKLVDDDELGKVMALLAVVEAVIPLVFRPVYSKAYSASSDTHPGAFFYISCAVNLCGVLLYFVIWRMQKRQAREEAEDAKKNDDLGGVANTAFQGDEGHPASSSNGSANHAVERL
ncbi:proton-coupled folate transporter-like [Thrips palmi]|uniref:Proton-coupled folate transporter-like n=1 Tax=Thrips palmi TaxID=161013 RepID=A0A6P8ZKI1_THRPL|nr:proton-coupled folate transporter-like [Thrips palmi]XP_034237144.1 proton-coupled folate transporter-like [Thrips palmi]